MIARKKPDRHPDVDYVVDKLLEYGVLKENACIKLAEMFRGLDAFSQIVHGSAESGAPATAPRRLPSTHERTTTQNGRSRLSPFDSKHDPDEHPQRHDLAEDDGLSPVARTISRKRGFDISERELRELYEVMTAKQIAQMHDVSVATINNRLRQYGISRRPRRSGFQPAPPWTEREETAETREEADQGGADANVGAERGGNDAEGDGPDAEGAQGDEYNQDPVVEEYSQVASDRGEEWEEFED